MELLTECRKAKLDAKNTTEEPTIATKLPKSTTAMPQQTTSTTPNMNTATGGRPTTTMSAIATDSPPTITVVNQQRFCSTSPPLRQPSNKEHPMRPQLE